MPKGNQFAQQASTAEPSPTVLASNAGWSDIAPVAGRRRRGIPVDRPEYRVPLMSEIAEQPRNGLTVATTFAGGGGSSTGYEMAGYRVVWASEFEPHAVSTYRANHPSTIVDDRDIRTVTADEVLEACGGPPDLFDGSPPCQSFSMAGKRSKGWGESIKHADGTEQRADDLFDEYVRLVRGIQPRAFVAENVAGLVSGVSKGQFKQIMRDLTACGYVVRARVLDAQWLGVPQRRRRVIIIGLRDDLGFTDVPYPTPFPYRYSMLDACPWLAGAESRKLTIAELKRICSFPDDYILEGPYNQQWARLGNSVPPLMARAVASTLAPLLLGAS